MVLDKFPVPGRPTILITVGQGPIALSVGAGWGGLDIFTLIYPFSSPSLWETARYRLKYCLKGPLNPKQPTNQNLDSRSERRFALRSNIFNRMETLNNTSVFQENYIGKIKRHQKLSNGNHIDT